MSTDYLVTGRSAQKQRTREALVAATRELLAAGDMPTVDEAAAAAQVSRATAYRYFPTKDDLLAASHPEVLKPTLLPPDPPSDPAERLDLVLRELLAMIVATEPQQRAMLRRSLEADPSARGEQPLRQGRAIAWIREALQDLEPRLGAAALHRLVLAIRATTGIEALVWLVDIAGCTLEEAADLMHWSGRALLTQALTEAPPT